VTVLTGVGVEKVRDGKKLLPVSLRSSSTFS
jgi:hypothetical protein